MDRYGHVGSGGQRLNPRLARMDARSQSLAMESVGADAVVPPRPSWRGRLRGAHGRAPPARRARRRGVRLGRGVVLRAEPGARLVVEAGAALGDGARLEARGGTLRVGAGSVLGERCALVGAVTVGRECVVGAWARAEGGARLGDRARLAAHAVALDGARVAPAPWSPPTRSSTATWRRVAVVQRQTRAPRSSS